MSKYPSLYGRISGDGEFPCFCQVESSHVLHQLSMVNYLHGGNGGAGVSMH